MLIFIFIFNFTFLNKFYLTILYIYTFGFSAFQFENGKPVLVGSFTLLTIKKKPFFYGSLLMLGFYGSLLMLGQLPLQQARVKKTQRLFTLTPLAKARSNTCLLALARGFSSFISFACFL